MFDIKKVQEEAEKEIMDEKLLVAKKRIKSKLNERESAKRILANIEREIDDLYVELGESI